MSEAQLRALVQDGHDDEETIEGAEAIAFCIWGKHGLRGRIYGMMRKNTNAPLFKFNNGPLTARRSALAAWILEKEYRG